MPVSSDAVPVEVFRPSHRGMVGLSPRCWLLGCSRLVPTAQLPTGPPWLRVGERGWELDLFGVPVIASWTAGSFTLSISGIAGVSETARCRCYLRRGACGHATQVATVGRRACMKHIARAEGFAGFHLNLPVLHRVLRLALVHAQIHVSNYLRANRAGGCKMGRVSPAVVGSCP